jgi:predicted dienelactone hydrolase
MKAARRTFLLGTASAVVFANCLPGARSLQAQELPYQSINLDWTDSTRGRSVPARLYLPKAATAEQPVPLIVFSHGLGGSRNGYTYLGTHWASQGFASLHLQHVGSDRSLWSSGSPFSLASRLQDAANDSEAIDRVHDLRFALDRVLASELGARLDARRIVAAGHSYGANTSLIDGVRKFMNVRDLDIDLIDRPTVRAVGAGEATASPIFAALGNAIFDATGVRLRSVPFTPERLLAARQKRAA